MQLFKYIFLFFLFSCGPGETINSTNSNVYISFENNEFLCNSCLLLNIENNLVQIIFDQKTDLHTCEGSFNYRLINEDKIIVSETLNQELSYQLEHIENKEISDCLTTVLDFSVTNLGNNVIEVYINNDKYRLSK